MKNYTLKIVEDTDMQSPRSDDGDVGIMVLKHNRYNLPCEVSPVPFEDLSSWDDVKKYLVKEFKALCVLPVQGYDHGGLDIYIGDSHDRFDGGQLGFIFTTRRQLEKIGLKYEPKKIKNYLKQELEAYNHYIKGEGYGYVIEDEEGETVESCWGFYEESDAEEAGKEMLQDLNERDAREREKKLKVVIKNRVPLIHRNKALA